MQFPDRADKARKILSHSVQVSEKNAQIQLTITEITNFQHFIKDCLITGIDQVA